MGKVYLGNTQLANGTGKIYFGNVELGGGGSDENKYEVTIIDYDGTIIEQVKLDNGATYTLPSHPVHNGLTFVDWTSSETITNNKITINKKDVIIGANYTTTSGLSEFDIELPSTLLTIRGYAFSGATFNWGDGTSDTANADGYIIHTYAQEGKYTITYNGTKIHGYGSSSAYYQYEGFLTGYQNNTKGIIPLRRIRLSNNVSRFDASYPFCTSKILESIILSTNLTAVPRGLAYTGSINPLIKGIVIPNSVTTIEQELGNYGFRYVAIPKNNLIIRNQAFGNCYLLNLILPSGTTIYDAIIQNSNTKKILLENITFSGDGNYGNFNANHYLEKVEFKNVTASTANNLRRCFKDCYKLKSIDLGNINYLGQNMFENCVSIEKIKIPKNIATIPTETFTNCTSIIEYDFTEHESIPTLSNINAFYLINAACKIYVPDNLYNSWIIATNWSAYADYIYKASERS